MVSEGVTRTVRLAQKLSQLPDGLGDWSSQFLRIRFEGWRTQRCGWLGVVVDRTAEATASGKAGTAGTACRCCCAGCGPRCRRSVQVEILKPDAVLRTEQLRVSAIKDVFSGGQQLTAAIVCTARWRRCGRTSAGGRRASAPACCS
ncbi:hypothetical protein HBB16_16615 [Pseudonocardia sp. MCCB 268]|nr:hypothetical protein [Pseudonocardia cytotoxica]